MLAKIRDLIVKNIILWAVRRWRKDHCDQRFGQFVVNACGKNDIFHIEDGAMAEKLSFWMDAVDQGCVKPKSR